MMQVLVHKIARQFKHDAVLVGQTLYNRVGSATRAPSRCSSSNHAQIL